MARSEFVPPIGRRADGTTYDPVPADVEATAAVVVDAAFKVHSVLGPGLLEKVYEACLCRELTLRGIPFKRQVSVPVEYEGIKVDADLRLDLLVRDHLAVDLKAVEMMRPIDEAQVITYLNLLKLRLGLLVNFHTVRIKDGVKRIIR